MTTKNTPHATSPFINDEVADTFFKTLELIYDDWLAKDQLRKGKVEVTLPARLFRKQRDNPKSPITWTYEGDLDYAAIRLWEPGLVPHYDTPSHFQLFPLRPRGGNLDGNV